MTDKNKLPLFDLQIKILLIGDSDEGKTELLYKYGKSNKPSTIKTIGIDFQINNILIDDKRVKLQIWNTLGQERLRTVTTSYFRGAQGILLVFDVYDRKSFESIKKWYDQILLHTASSVKMALAGNYCERVDREVSEDEARAWARQCKNMAYFEVSPVTGANVDECFYHLAKIAKDNELLHISYRNEIDKIIEACDASDAANLDLPWQRSQLFIVGRHGAGKSALICKLLNEHHLPTSDAPQSGILTTNCVALNNDKSFNYGWNWKGIASLDFFEDTRVLVNSNLILSDQKNASSKFPHDGPIRRFFRKFTTNTNEDETTSASSINAKPRRDPISNYVTDLYRFKSRLLFQIHELSDQSGLDSIFPFYMRSCGIYAVMFDMSLLLSKDAEISKDCLANIKFWLNSIEANTLCEYGSERNTSSSNAKIGGGSSSSNTMRRSAPVALVGSRNDLVSGKDEHTLVAKILHENFSNMKAFDSLLLNGKLIFFPVDSTVHENNPTVEILLKSLEQAMMSSDHVRENKPLSWLAAYETIKGLRRSIVPYKTVVSNAAIHRITERDVPAMLKSLNDIGLIMWHDFPNLRDVILMNPYYELMQKVTLIHKQLALDDTNHDMQNRRVQSVSTVNSNAALACGNLDYSSIISMNIADLLLRQSSSGASKALVDLASDKSMFECISILLKSGVNPNHLGLDGNTALHVAGAHGFPQVVQVLLVGGADCLIHNNAGQRPYSLAFQRNNNNKNAECLMIFNRWPTTMAIIALKQIRVYSQLDFYDFFVTINQFIGTPDQYF